LINWRILRRVVPRQSPSSPILFEMSSDADWFFMLESLNSPGCVVCATG
jgi:hypothetical protein